MAYLQGSLFDVLMAPIREMELAALDRIDNAYASLPISGRRPVLTEHQKSIIASQNASDVESASKGNIPYAEALPQARGDVDWAVNQSTDDAQRDKEKRVAWLLWGFGAFGAVAIALRR